MITVTNENLDSIYREKQQKTELYTARFRNRYNNTEKSSLLRKVKVKLVRRTNKGRAIFNRAGRPLPLRYHQPVNQGFQNKVTKRELILKFIKIAQIGK